MQIFKKKDEAKQIEIDAAAYDLFGGGREYCRYYYDVSTVYRVVEFLFLAAFFVYVIISAVNNADSIKYENLEYIVRNFAFELDENEFNSSAIRYNPDESLKFTLFGKGLAVCGGSELDIYSATGRKTGSDRHSYASPIIDASDKYVIVCDNGGDEYSVYNMFSKVHTDKLDYPIRALSMSDDGHYAIITRTDDYPSAVYLYDSDFKLVNKYKKNGYILSVDIDNERVLICTLNVNDSGEYVTETMLCMIGEDTASAVTSFTASFPLKSVLFDEGFGVICDDAVYYYNEGGFSLGTYKYKSDPLHGFDVSDNAVMLVFENDRINKVYTTVMLDETGKKLSEEQTTGVLISYEIFEKNAYLLTGDGIISINDTGVKTVEYKNAAPDSELLAYSKDKVYVCRSTTADVVSIKD